jgi:hypothetical protein
MTHKHQRPLALDYIALVLAAVLWFSFLLSGTPYTPPSPFQNFRNPIHDARPVRGAGPANARA